MADAPNSTRRDSVLAPIDENQLPANTGVGTRAMGDVKSQDTQKSRARRKSIKQIVMRITTAPMVTGEKLKFGAIHSTPSNPVVVLPSNTLMPLDPPPPPPPTFFRKSASSSVPSLPLRRKQISDVTNGGGGGKMFKGFRKRWNAVLETVRR
jgi:hypothetical protein